MKKSFLALVLTVLLYSCATQKASLSEQIGPGKTYSVITFSPANLEASSKEFAEKWLVAEKGVFASDKRKLQRMTISFSEGNILVNFGYTPPDGRGLASAIFTYRITKDDKGDMSFSLASKNANAKVISAGVRGITDEMLEKYKFKIDWVLEKVPGSYGQLAGMQSTDMPQFWFYGTIK